MTGVIPRRPQVLDQGGLSDWPHSSSKTIQPPSAPPRCFYPRPGLFLPHLDRAVVALDGPPRADLAGPATAAQQVPDPRHGVDHLELRRDQVPDARPGRARRARARRCPGRAGPHAPVSGGGRTLPAHADGAPALRETKGPAPGPGGLPRRVFSPTLHRAHGAQLAGEIGVPGPGWLPGVETAAARENRWQLFRAARDKPSGQARLVVRRRPGPRARPHGEARSEPRRVSCHSRQPTWTGPG
jgi:hypothetical protein